MPENMAEAINGFHVIAGTGSRSFQQLPTPEIARIYDRVCIDLQVALVQHEGLVRVMSGGAIGWDAWLARAAKEVGIPYVLCIPNKGYGAYYWGRAGKADVFQRMLDQAYFVEYLMEDVYKRSGLYVNGRHSNFLRNDRMVGLAHQFYVYGPTSSGTKDCLATIKSVGKPFKEYK